MRTGRAADVAGRGTLWLMAGRVFFTLSGFAVAILLARGLGPVDFGLYGLAMTLLGWTQILVIGAVPGAVARLAPAHGYDPRIPGTAVTLVIAVAAALYGAVWLAAPFLERMVQLPGAAAAVRLLLLDLLLLAGLAVWQAVFLTHGRLGWIALILTLQAGVKATIIAVLFVAGVDIWSVLVAHLAGSVTALAVVALRERLPRPVFDRGYARALIATAVPLLTYVLVYQFQANVGVWWVAAVRGPGAEAAPGHFTAALQITRTLALVPAVLTSVLFARMAEAVARGRRDEAARELATAMRYALILLVPALAALWAAADGIVALLFGPRFAPAAAMLRWLALNGVAAGLLDIALHAVMATRSIWWGPALAGSVVVVSLTAGAWLVPTVGPAGVAAALAVGSCAALAAALVLTGRTVGLHLHPASLLRIAAVSTGLYLVLRLWPAPPTWLVPQFVLAGLAYFTGLWIVGELERRDLRLFRG